MILYAASAITAIQARFRQRRAGDAAVGGRLHYLLQRACGPRVCAVWFVRYVWWRLVEGGHDLTSCVGVVCGDADSREECAACGELFGV